MSPSRAANLSLTLVVARWLPAAYGILSQLGDPNPHLPASIIEKERQSSGMMMAGRYNPASDFGLAFGFFIHAGQMARFARRRHLAQLCDDNLHNQPNTLVHWVWGSFPLRQE
jgi:hypothetical protein